MTSSATLAITAAGAMAGKNATGKDEGAYLGGVAASATTHLTIEFVKVLIARGPHFRPQYFKAARHGCFEGSCVAFTVNAVSRLLRIQSKL